MHRVTEAPTDSMLQALRAVRETRTNLGGIKAFRKHVLTGGSQFLKMYLEGSPAFEEVRMIWDHQQKVRPPHEACCYWVHDNVSTWYSLDALRVIGGWCRYDSDNVSSLWCCSS